MPAYTYNQKSYSYGTGPLASLFPAIYQKPKKSTQTVYKETEKLAPNVSNYQDKINEIAKQLREIQQRIATEGITSGATGEVLLQPGMYDVATNTIKQTGTPITSSYVEPKTMTDTQNYLTMFDTEYANAGLDTIKQKIETLDSEIAARKAARDQALLDEMGKPIPQWMITGRKKLEIDAATADLNRLIDERNAMAKQYNTGLSEVERKVNYAIEYQKALLNQLAAKQAQSNWEKEYALKLEKARQPETVSIPSSAKEYEYAGGQAGTGMTFAEWLGKAKKEVKPFLTKDYLRNTLNITKLKMFQPYKSIWKTRNQEIEEFLDDLMKKIEAYRQQGWSDEEIFEAIQ